MPKQPRMPNVQQMMAQVQKMQKDMELAQEELKGEVVEASAGGGMVSVKVSGDLVVREVSIDPAAVDPEDVEILADMVIAAVNEALRAAQELAERKLGGATAGLKTMGRGDVGYCEALLREMHRPDRNPANSSHHHAMTVKRSHSEIARDCAKAHRAGLESRRGTSA